VPAWLQRAAGSALCCHICETQVKSQTFKRSGFDDLLAAIEIPRVLALLLVGTLRRPCQAVRGRIPPTMSS